jgi:DNA invertase Pin-like site-specific DNA recombinase
VAYVAAQIKVARGYGLKSYCHTVATLKRQEMLVGKAFRRLVASDPAWAQAVWGGFYSEGARSPNRNFRKRPVGNVLLGCSQPGDAILVSHHHRIFLSDDDCYDTIAAVLERGIELHILSKGLVIGPATDTSVLQLAKVLKNMIRTAKRRKIRETVAQRLINPIPFKAPVGWRKVKFLLKGSERAGMVPDEAERALVRTGARMRRRKVTIEDVTKFFAEQGLKRALDWNSVRRHLIAARKDFVLDHMPPPIPPNAEPVPTLGIDD